MVRKKMICADCTKLKDLGFNKFSKKEWLYSTKGQHRIIVNQENGIIQFVHYDLDLMRMFKIMVEMGIIEEREIKINQCTKIDALERRIADLERKLGKKERE